MPLKTNEIVHFTQYHRELRDKERVQTDCETNLKAIKTLEEASYRLWVESNTAFLDESLLSTCTDDESYMWDDECFFDSLQLRGFVEKQRYKFLHKSLLLTCRDDDYWMWDECFFDSHPKDDSQLEDSTQELDDASSLCSSTSISERSFSDFGYMGDLETSLNQTSEEQKTQTVKHKKKRSTTKRVKHEHDSSDSAKTSDSAKSSDEVLNEHEGDDHWVIVDHVDQNCHVVKELPAEDVSNMSNISLHTEIVPECSADEDSDTAVEDDDEDWTILSLKVTEIHSAKPSDLDMNLSRDSGVLFSDTCNSHIKNSSFDRIPRNYQIQEPYR